MKRQADDTRSEIVRHRQVASREIFEDGMAMDPKAPPPSPLDVVSIQASQHAVETCLSADDVQGGGRETRSDSVLDDAIRSRQRTNISGALHHHAVDFFVDSV